MHPTVDDMMRQEKQAVVVIAGPVHLPALAEFVPNYSQEGLELPDGCGGYNLTMLVRERLRRQMRTDVVTLSPDLPMPIARWGGDKLRLWVVRQRTKRKLRDLYRQERFHLAEAIGESQATLCHAHWTYDFALAAIRQKRMPWVLTVHDHSWNYLFKSAPDYLPLFAMSLYVMRRAPQASVVSEYLRPWVQFVRGKDPVVIPNMISIPDGVEVRPPEAPVVAAALAWARHKNVKGCLAAFNEVRKVKPDVMLQLMGPGLQENSPAHKWARDAGLDSGVCFRGNLLHKEVLQTFAASSVVFHPSLEESFGMSVAEAMWLGVPVVAARQAGGSRWLVGQGQYGELVDGKSTGDMAQGLKRALEGGESVREKIRLARERTREICDPDVVLEGYENLYREALGQNADKRV